MSVFIPTYQEFVNWTVFLVHIGAVALLFVIYVGILEVCAQGMGSLWFQWRKLKQMKAETQQMEHRAQRLTNAMQAWRHGTRGRV